MVNIVFLLHGDDNVRDPISSDLISIQRRPEFWLSMASSRSTLVNLYLLVEFRENVVFLINEDLL